MRYRLSFLGLAVAAALLLLFGVAPDLNANQNPVPEPVQPDAVASTDVGSGCSGDGVGMANPADVYCYELGYELEAVDTDAGQYSLCVFPDGSKCDAWSFLEGTCGESYSYCARQGYDLIVKTDGQNPFSVEYAVCVDGEEEIGAVTQLTGLSEKATRGISPAEPTAAPLEPGVSVVGLPASFDWTNKDGQDWVTRVKNQSACGSCWAFSAVGTVEAIYNIDKNNSDLDLDLSEETLNSDCLGGSDCCGGSYTDALDYIRDNGIPDEDCLPYDEGYYGTGACDCYPTPPCPSGCSGLPASCSHLNCADTCGDAASRLVSIDGHYVWL